MNYRDPSVWIDVVTEFLWNAATFVTGLAYGNYVLGTAQPIMPTKGAWVGAALAGIIGAANHIRALRKAVPA